MNNRVVAFTDTYLPTINGVTYTIKSWRERWEQRGGRMDVVYPHADDYAPEDGEHPVRSLPFPFYEDFQFGLPQLPGSIPDADVLHLHGPFTLGISGLRFARKQDAPVVASYHTPTSQYANYVAPTERVERWVSRVANKYERKFYRHVDMVLAPSDETRKHLLEAVGVDVPVEVVPNGVDVDRFRPVDGSAFLARHGIDGSRPLVGYTGRHGYEKNLSHIIDAAEGLDATVVFGGDGPAREDLEAKAAASDADVRFLGYLDREEMAEFYSVLDVFAFPSPVETQGLVALEAYACGTPVVGVNAGALSETISDGVTGYHYENGDVRGFRESIRRALANNESLRDNCLDRREEFSLEASVNTLESVYRQLG